MVPLLAAAAALSMIVPAPGGYGSAPRSGTKLTLSYASSTASLRCDPVGGSHPAAAAACTTLASVGGDPDRLTPGSTACFLIYQPVTAEITGTWKGTPVHWTHRYGNGCEMRRATGPLFRFPA